MPTIKTPCGDLDYAIPGFTLPTINLSISIPFPPKIPFQFPDCDLIKNAIGATPEPDEDSTP